MSSAIGRASRKATISATAPPASASWISGATSWARERGSRRCRRRSRRGAMERDPRGHIEPARPSRPRMFEVEAHGGQQQRPRVADAYINAAAPAAPGTPDAHELLEIPGPRQGELTLTSKEGRPHAGGMRRRLHGGDRDKGTPPLTGARTTGPKPDSGAGRAAAGEPKLETLPRRRRGCCRARGPAGSVVSTLSPGGARYAGIARQSRPSNRALRLLFGRLLPWLRRGTRSARRGRLTRFRTPSTEENKLCRRRQRGPLHTPNRA